MIFYVVLYLVAIVAANVSVTIWGPSVSILNAFVFIGFNLISRDYLHDAWGKHIKRNMILLILTGTILSALGGAGRIAMASALAFLLSESTDTMVYHALRKYPRLIRQNGSNIPSAIVDSFAFPILAFGFPVLWGIVAGQFIAKISGGVIWSVILNMFNQKRESRNEN